MSNQTISLPHAEYYTHLTVNQLINEQWRNIKEYPNYQVSNLGRVKRMRSSFKFRLYDKILRPQHHKLGYLLIGLRDPHIGNKTCTIHRLVADAFIQKTDDIRNEVNHLDRNRWNNTIYNLEWCTRKENMQHDHGASHAWRLKPIAQYTKDGVLVNNWSSAVEAYDTLKDEIKISAVCIRMCARGEIKTSANYIWKYI